MPVWGEDRWRQDCDGSRPQRADRLLIRPASGRQAGTGLFARTDPHQDTRKRSHCINESRAKSTGTTLTTAPDGTPTHSQCENSVGLAERASRAGASVGVPVLEAVFAYLVGSSSPAGCWRLCCCSPGAIVRRSSRFSCCGTSWGSSAGSWVGRSSSPATGPCWRHAAASGRAAPGARSRCGRRRYCVGTADRARGAGADPAARAREHKLGLRPNRRRAAQARHQRFGDAGAQRARSGIPPAPQRDRQSGRTFLRQHGDSMLACDFLTVDTLWLQRLYVLVFLSIAAAEARTWPAPATRTRHRCCSRRATC